MCFLLIAANSRSPLFYYILKQTHKYLNTWLVDLFRYSALPLAFIIYCLLSGFYSSSKLANVLWICYVLYLQPFLHPKWFEDPCSWPFQHLQTLKFVTSLSLATYFTQILCPNMTTLFSLPLPCLVTTWVTNLYIPLSNHSLCFSSFDQLSPVHWCFQLSVWARLPTFPAQPTQLPPQCLPRLPVSEIWSSFCHYLNLSCLISLLLYLSIFTLSRNLVANWFHVCGWVAGQHRRKFHTHEK